MDDKDLRNLFNDFDPKLTPDNIFMNKMENSLRGVELLNEIQKVDLRRNRLSAYLSFGFGFLSGVIMTLCYPWLADLMKAIFASFSNSVVPTDMFISTVVWIFIAAVSICSTFGAYNFIKMNLGGRYDSNLP